MIVAFADRRRSSDASNSSNVVRKSKLNNSATTTAGQMIVSFSERRRPSVNDASTSLNSITRRKNERRPPVSSSSSSSSRLLSGSNKAGGGPSRKQTAPMDPIGISWRKAASLLPKGSKDRSTRRESRKMTSRQSSSSSSTRPSSSSVDPDNEGNVIVEFPERNPRVTSGSRRRLYGGGGDSFKDISLGDSFKDISLSGIFGKKNEAQRVREQTQKPLTSYSSCRNKKDPKQKQKQPSSKHTTSREKQQDTHTRQFTDAVNWRNTSIDWGDEEGDDNETNISHDGDNSSSSTSHHESFRPAKVQRPVDPARGRRCVNKTKNESHHHSSSCTRSTECCLSDSITSSVNSLLSQPVTSLLSITRKSDS